MKKGGYKIIDLKDNNLVTAGDGVTIKGLHNAIEASYRKPLLLSGLVFDGVEKNDCFAQPVVSNGSYKFSVYGKMLTITGADLVTLANA